MCSKELNKYFPSNRSDDLCLFFCLYPSPMPTPLEFWWLSFCIWLVNKNVRTNSIATLCVNQWHCCLASVWTNSKAASQLNIFEKKIIISVEVKRRGLWGCTVKSGNKFCIGNKMSKNTSKGLHKAFLWFSQDWIPQKTYVLW